MSDDTLPPVPLLRLEFCGEWFDLLPRTRLLPDTEHWFRIRGAAPVREVRLDIYPDGGISRLRGVGEVPPARRDAKRASGRGPDRGFGPLPHSRRRSG